MSAPLLPLHKFINYESYSSWSLAVTIPAASARPNKASGHSCQTRKRHWPWWLLSSWLVAIETVFLRRHSISTCQLRRHESVYRTAGHRRLSAKGVAWTFTELHAESCAR